MYLGQFCNRAGVVQLSVPASSKRCTYPASLVDLEIHLQAIAVPLHPCSPPRELVPPPRRKLDAYSRYAPPLLL